MEFQNHSPQTTTNSFQPVDTPSLPQNHSSQTTTTNSFQPAENPQLSEGVRRMTLRNFSGLEHSDYAPPPVQSVQLKEYCGLEVLARGTSTVEVCAHTHTHTHTHTHLTPHNMIRWTHQPRISCNMQWTIRYVVQPFPQ
jgi:hypothetical protein